ncbi:MAG: HAD family hydrolase [Desulfobacterales bacterium]|uniref:HAD family hydrolase n=1 Tax=Candidatus Desulfatibia profunda TaxID=2841695 RepID=A0A8J6NMX4_9BACT|nr:HAD family hydrolase [Candidatus Desulfatibia profunda]MBL7179980.1 HAD family hydrolase [Desulfobacterales bacterium]
MLKHDLISKYIRPLSPNPTSLHASGQLKETVRCVLFDVYGTLFISASGDIGVAGQVSRQTDQLKNLLQTFGIQKAPDLILEAFFATITAEHEEQKENGVDFPEVEIDRIWMRVLKSSDLELIRAFALEFELIVNPVYPMPNLEKTLAGCKALNLLMGIISNAQFYTPALFHWFLGSHPEHLGFHPDLLFYSYRCGYAKPSAHMFQLAAENLKHMNIPAQAALYLGNDMLNDIYPAQKIGFQTALFAGDARSLRLRKDIPECSNLSADIVITDLEQLLDHIRNAGSSFSATKTQRHKIGRKRQNTQFQKTRDK